MNKLASYKCPKKLYIAQTCKNVATATK